MLGQDPYPVPGVATGIAFGVNEDIGSLPPSLEVILGELANWAKNPFIVEKDLDITLMDWMSQGVLMLNASLTCDEYNLEDETFLFKNGSHSNYWRVVLMEQLFEWFNENLKDVVFVFLGKKAQYYNKFITNHVYIDAVHPVADWYTGKNMFRGSQIFDLINQELNNINKKEIKWLIKDSQPPQIP